MGLPPLEVEREEPTSAICGERSYMDRMKFTRFRSNSSNTIFVEYIQLPTVADNEGVPVGIFLRLLKLNPICALDCEEELSSLSEPDDGTRLSFCLFGYILSCK